MSSALILLGSGFPSLEKAFLNRYRFGLSHVTEARKGKHKSFPWWTGSDSPRSRGTIESPRISSGKYNFPKDQNCFHWMSKAEDLEITASNYSILIR